jgi:pimeloyl-ACP methyl ester carboxylesterase
MDASGVVTLTDANRCAVRDQVADGVRVVLITPPTIARQDCITIQGFGARLDGFEVQRYRLIAATLEVRLAVVGWPRTWRNERLRAGEWTAALAGRYGRLGHRMLAAGHGVLGTVATDPVHLLGYSLGSSVVASIAAAGPAAVTVSVIEPVALRHWSPPRLLAAVRAEDEVAGYALAETAGVDGAVEPSPLSMSLADLTLAAGLCRGTLNRDLLRSAQAWGTPLVLVRGASSRLCPADDIARLAEQVRSAGTRVDVVEVAGTHAMWHSLPRVAALARRLAGLWDAAA